VGRYSPTKTKIVIKVRPEVHERFYRMKKITAAALGTRITSGEFLEMLLNSYVVEERPPAAIRRY